jgi:hypothetical protein
MRGPIGEVGRNDAADETMALDGQWRELKARRQITKASKLLPAQPQPAGRPQQWKKFELLAASCLGPPHFGHRDRLA